MVSCNEVVYEKSVINYTICVGYTRTEVVAMDYRTIGANLRKIRVQKKLRQEDVAERANLSVNYVGAVERGERLPSLETFIALLNATGASADIVLSDVLENGYIIKNSLLADKLKSVNKDELARIYDMLDVLLKHAK